jgi:hypothetical protein
LSAPREALITCNGIIYEEAIYPFRSFLDFRGGLSFRKADKSGPAVLILSFTPLVGRFIVQPFDVVVPVPSGEENATDRSWSSRVRMPLAY